MLFLGSISCAFCVRHNDKVLYKDLRFMKESSKSVFEHGQPYVELKRGRNQNARVSVRHMQSLVSWKNIKETYLNKRFKENWSKIRQCFM